MVRVSRPRAAASRLKAPAFRSEVAAPLPMVQGSPLKVEVSLPMGPMVRASRLMAPVLTVLAQALASQQMAPVLRVLAQALASQQMAPVLRVLAQALASQPMVPVQAPPVQAPRQMVPVQAPPELEPPPVSSLPLPQQAAAEGCRSSSAGRR